MSGQTDVILLISYWLDIEFLRFKGNSCNTNHTFIWWSDTSSSSWAIISRVSSKDNQLQEENVVHLSTAIFFWYGTRAFLAVPVSKWKELCNSFVYFGRRTARKGRETR